jgi:hypothetical protein
MLTALLVLAALAAGFGLGRVKNAQKLAAVKAEVTKVEGVASADLAKVVAIHHALTLWLKVSILYVLQEPMPYLERDIN